VLQITNQAAFHSAPSQIKIQLFTHKMKATIQIATWNLNTVQTAIDFTSLLKSTLSPSPEILVLGLQEIHSQFSVHLPSQQARFEDQKRIGDPIDSLEHLFNDLSKALDVIHAKGARYKPLYLGRRSALGMIIFIKQGS
jgi:hypothetical protein